MANITCVTDDCVYNTRIGGDGYPGGCICPHIAIAKGQCCNYIKFDHNNIVSNFKILLKKEESK